MSDGERKDIHLTSSGVGHRYRPGYYFPSSNFKRVIGEPLPDLLSQNDQVPENVRFQTTTASAHDSKPSGCPRPYGNREPMYKKAPGHWKVNYVKDLHEKLDGSNWRRPLTMGNQKSETHEKFSSKPGINFNQEFKADPQGFIYNNHINDGPSKKVVQTTENPNLKGKIFYPNNKGIMDLNDMYLTTAGREHRKFKPHELNSYAKKDVPTYWQCEEYSKAWGHGLQHNPLPKSAIQRDRLPMRDNMAFKSETQVRRVPKTASPISLNGVWSQYSDSFQCPSDVKMREIHYCPVDTPFTLARPGSKPAMSVPQMYKTEYENIGSRKTITV